MRIRYLLGLLAFATNFLAPASGLAQGGIPVKLLPLAADASQSSTANTAPASRAIDGNPDGVFTNNSVTHTNSEANPWWQVDLKASYRLDSVKLWNRTDCCAERLADVSIFVSNTPFSSADPAVLRTQTGVKEFAVKGILGQVTSIPTPAFGRYVRVQINGTGILSLAEVEVFEEPSLAMGGNLARGKTVTASSSYELGGWGLTRIVDGINTSTTASQGWSSNNNTLLNHSEWVQVDLGAVKGFDKIVLTPRTDGAQTGYGFPVDFRVQVSQDNLNWTTLVDRANYPLPDARAQSFDVGPAAGRYVRVTGSSLRWNASDFAYRMQFAEFEIFASPALTAGPLYSPKAAGLLGEYFSGTGLSGLPVLKRTEAIDFNWGTGSPATAVPADNFSARWTGDFVAPTAGSYQFQTVSDDGVRLWIDDIQVINNWTVHAATANTTAGITLAAGQRVKIKLEYFEAASGASLSLLWKTPGSTAFVPIPAASLYVTEREGLQTANVARGKAVTASSTNTAIGWSTANLVDGVLTSSSSSYGWSSNNTTTINHTEWVRVDLGVLQSFNQIALTPRTDGVNAGYGFPVDFQIEVSADGTTWTTAVTRTGYPKPDASTQSFDLGNVAARYVRVTGTNLRANPNDFSLFRMQFAEIEVFTAPDLLPSASQSSTANNGVPTRAIDGDSNGTFTANSVTHTLNQPNPWWQVDLKTIQKLDSIRLWNRTDCCTTRLSNVSVFVSNLPFTSNDPAVLRTQAGVSEYPVSGALGQITDIATPVFGRYVRVQLNTNGADGILSLAEVEIFGAVAGDGLRGEYFANKTLSGTPVYQAIEPVDYDWDVGAPNYTLPSDGFSARWIGDIEAPATGNYQLQTLSDSAVRVWVDDKLVIDNWAVHAAAVDTSANLAWTAGKRSSIRVEFFENVGPAVIRLRWLTPGATSFVPVPAGALYAPAATGLKAEYFGNATLSGSPALKRIENVDFAWGAGSPSAAVPTDNFSARWSGELRVPATGIYRLQTVSNDGVRLWLDNILVIDNWTGHAETANNSPALALTAGRSYSLKMEYYEGVGTAIARLRWLTPGSIGYGTIPASNLYTPLPIGPQGYAYCANESEPCAFTGVGRVAYGANGTFVIKTVTNGTACSNAVFTDPVPGIVKACFYTMTLPTGPAGYTYCGGEGENCAFTGTQHVSYGANGTFTDRVLTDGTPCTSTVFSVTATGSVNSCFTAPYTPPVVVNESVFTTQVPVTPAATDNVAYEMGMKFRAAQPGRITALRFWKTDGDTGPHTGHLWAANGIELAAVQFTAETASGWQEQALPTPVSITENTTYVVSVNTPALFPLTSGGLTTAVVNGNLSSVADGANGVFGVSGAFPTSSFNNSNYFRDVVYQLETIGPAAKLAVTAAPVSVSLGSVATFTITVQDSNGHRVNTATNPVSFTVNAGGTGAGAVLPATAVAPTNGQATFTFTPTATGTVTFSASAANLTSAAVTLNIVDTGASIFSTQTPTQNNASDSGASYEMGMKFRPTAGGEIRALRYYRSPSDTGSHVGHLWSETGESLATVSFTNETASGWQEQVLTAPVTVNANTTYVVSVNANGFYPITVSGLATPVVNGNLTTVADGANGVFGTPGAFPTSSFSNSNYFRDVAFVAQPAGPPAKLALTAAKLSTPLNVPVTYTVTVQDANGQNVLSASSPITLTVGGVTGSFSAAMPINPVAGQASVDFTPSAMGSGTITASSPGLTSASKALSVTAAISSNPVTVENQLAGTSGWRLGNPVTETAPEIAGYATATSVNAGGSLPMKISLATPGNYSISVYRLGYYGGLGGRLMGTSGTLSGATQTPCPEIDTVTHLIECNWSTSYTLNVGSNWTSGLYVANLTAAASGKQSQIWFVVRNDSSNSDILFQSSFTTFLAYNSYGSTTFRSLYGFNSTNGQPALKVSFDRPFGQVTTDQARYDNMLKHERNMVMWLESQGYNVSYSTDLDTHEHPERLLTHRVFLSVGHDEYWSLEMRNGVEAARDAGVNLGFFAGNSAYWRVRFEPSSSGQANRVMVCYKNPLLNDPVAPTYVWRGPDNNRPENALLGVMYVGDDVSYIYGGYNHVVTNATDPYYANTGFVEGSAATGLVGFEWDAVVNNGFTPPGLVKLSASTPTATEVPPLPAGLTTGASNSNVVRYTAASGAKVFSTGSIQWMWGLNDDGVVNSRADRRIQQMTVNVLADMNARPVTPADNLIVP